MKKFFKIFFINIIFIFAIILSAEIICICITFKIQNWENFKFKEHITRIIKSYTNHKYFEEYDFRPVAIGKNNKKPIVIVGCSYAYGLRLDENETISAVLSDKTDRTVYNLGGIATSVREILYIFRNDNLRNKLLNNQDNFEYVIYPYISNHRYRLYTDIKPYTYSPYFKETKNGLEYYEKNKLIANSYIYKKFLDWKYSEIYYTEAFRLMCVYLKEINKEIKKHYPNTKFVVLVYEDYLNEKWNILEKEGIIIVKVKDIANIDVKSPEYTISPKDFHPNAKAWQVIVPKLVEELNL